MYKLNKTQNFNERERNNFIGTVSIRYLNHYSSNNSISIFVQYFKDENQVNRQNKIQRNV